MARVLHFLLLAKMVKETAVLTAYSARITDRPAYRKNDRDR